MKHILAICLITIAFGPSAFAVYNVGDTVENICWKDHQNKDVCLKDLKGVKVLLYNAGWCGPCNQEFQELSPQVKKYDGKAVNFISLSCSGWSHGSSPTQDFLKEWKQEHNLSFTVAASPRDCGKLFIPPTIYIPNVAIIDADGKLALAEIDPGVSGVFSKVDQLLSQNTVDPE